MEDRLEIWLELIAGKLDRLIELGENVERASRSQGMPEEWGEHEGDHFAGADDKIVAVGPTDYSDDAIKTVAEESKPAWEPKVGDWVIVTRPENWKACKNPEWVSWMHHCHNKVLRVSRYEKKWGARLVNLDGVDFFFDPNWLSPAETSKDEYREPVLPGDAVRVCEFSNDYTTWVTSQLSGWLWYPDTSGWISKDGDCWKYARIKINP